MSTIASPRDPSAPFPRRTNSSIITPTSSSRPSLDAPASTSGSPNTSTTTTTTTHSKRGSNRAALREYYNLRAAANNKPLPSTPTVEITDHLDNTTTTIPSTSELDTPDFHPDTYIAHLLSTSTLADLLRTYTRVLGEMRALDAEKKALVYDNYSKLIAATETIRRMRAAAQNSTDGIGGGGNGGGSGEALEGLVEGIYRVAVGLRGEVREGIVERERLRQGQAEGGEGDAGGGDGRRERTRALAREVVKVPGRVRRLVEEGREEEARREWEAPRRLLVRWRELGLGGEEVGALIEEGDVALRGGGEGEGSENSSVAA
ncbi:Vps51/Vps67-domain-containing protein [Parachaetomium inaequale]|uniref:Vacuolar protein sorting-associated protein 51 homolog n=1 Tax=Parachaetomium inaequale TaxID=2588326 RepID=A0AAN6SMP2_9PEZI|nr:Vps51/Vps67-domain-containing protein [Parachaetomium inaequale]